MIAINLNPAIVQLGPLLLTWHGLLSAAGLGVGVWLTARLVQGTALTADDVLSVALPVALGGVVGARLLFVLENWPLFTTNPLGVLAINEGGIAVYGAVIGDIINGEHHGREATGLPWRVVYTHPNTAGEPGVPVHPAVAYELLWDFAAAALRAWLLRAPRPRPRLA